MSSLSEQAVPPPGSISARFKAWLCGVLGYVMLAACGASALSLLTWQIADPSLTHAASGPVSNLLGPVGAIISDLIMQLFGLAGVFVFLPPVFWALQLIGKGQLDSARIKFMLAPTAVLLLACAASSLPRMAGWPLPYSFGGALGDVLLRAVTSILAMIRPERASAAAGLFCLAGGMTLLMTSLGLSQRDLKLICQRPRGVNFGFVVRAWHRLGEMSERATAIRREPTLGMSAPVSSPRGGLVPYPSARTTHGHALRSPELGPPDPIGDDDIDPNELKRIATMCAPDRSGKSAAVDDPPSILFRPHRAEDHYASAPFDPIRAARQVMTAPGNNFPMQQQHRGARQPSAQFQDGPEPSVAWPAPEPVAPRMPPMVPPTNGWRPQSLPGGDDLYGRAVAIVLDDRRASADYLQQRLAIGYMRASDLIERMEREGILGAPVYNGMRPILIGGQGSREI